MTESDDVVIAILVKNKGYCLQFYLNCIYNQDYNKKNIHLYIRTNDNTDNTVSILKTFIERFKDQYNSVYYDDTDINSDIIKYKEHEWNSVRFQVLADIRQKSVDYAIKLGCHYFVVDCDNFITKSTLSELFVDKNKGVIAPILVTNTWYSNYHYNTTVNGYCEPHEYYKEILIKKISGLIKVNVVHCTYFIGNLFLKYVKYKENSDRHEYVIFSEKMRQENIPQYINNTKFYGFLILCDEGHEYLDQIRHFSNRLNIQSLNDETHIEFKPDAENIK